MCSSARSGAGTRQIIMSTPETISPEVSPDHKIARDVLVWTPRILGILFAIFISMFAMDVFQEKAGFWNTAVALGMHLIPTAIVVLVLMVCWRYPFAGVVFILLGLFYIFSLQRMSWMTDVIIAGPLILCGVLFLLQAAICRKRQV